VAHLRLFSAERRYAALVATALDTATILIDETLEMHERFLGKQFKKAERKHLRTFQENSKAINDKVRLYAIIGQTLIDARDKAVDPFAEVERLMPWDTFKASVEEAAKLARPGEFDFLALISDSYSQLRRYAPEFLEAFEFRSTPASEELVKAVALLRDLNAKNARRVPEDAPTGFIRQRWEKHVFTADGIDRRFYETCVLSELGKTLRAGDLWVAGSRRYKDFDEYLATQGNLSGVEALGSRAGDRSRLHRVPRAARRATTLGAAAGGPDRQSGRVARRLDHRRRAQDHAARQEPQTETPPRCPDTPGANSLSCNFEPLEE
jgi:hypothetical protein